MLLKSALKPYCLNRWDEESKPGYVCLEVGVPKHLDSSLIDVDVHPTYVSIIVKSKVYTYVALHSTHRSHRTAHSEFPYYF